MSSLINAIPEDIKLSMLLIFLISALQCKLIDTKNNYEDTNSSNAYIKSNFGFKANPIT